MREKSLSFSFLRQTEFDWQSYLNCWKLIVFTRYFTPFYALKSTVLLVLQVVYYDNTFNFYQSVRKVFFLLSAKCHETVCNCCIITWPVIHLRSQFCFYFWALSVSLNRNSASGNTEREINILFACCPCYFYAFQLWQSMKNRLTWKEHFN